MQTLDHDSVIIHVAAPPDAVYQLVADVTRMPEFSPEILSCSWLDSAHGPAVGVRFAARNKVPSRPAWTNTPVITTAVPTASLHLRNTVRGRCVVLQAFWGTRPRSGQASLAVVSVTTSGRVTAPPKWRSMNASMSSSRPCRSVSSIICVPEYESMSLRYSAAL